MKLSIIIPVYNEQDTIFNQLSRLIANTNNQNVEIIVVVSPETTDDSYTVCSNINNIITKICPQKGRAFQMNYGVKVASGDVFCFLHADVQLPSDYYQQIKNVFDKGYQFGFFSYEFDKKTTLLNLNSKFTKKDGIFAGGGDQAQFFTKEIFQNLKGYNEEFCIMEDFEMMHRIRKQKIPFTIIQSKATVSARKYNQNSWLKVNLINGYVFLLFKMGVHPTKLRKTYKSLLRESV